MTAVRPQRGLAGDRFSWSRVARRAGLGAVVLLALVQLIFSAGGREYGLDFFGGTWHAGWAFLHGASPYPVPATGTRLLTESSGFMTPPPLVLLGIPLSLLPFSVAVALFNLACALALVGALALLEVRDRRIYVLALCSFPFVSSLALGQPDGLFALAAAVCWRYRDSWPGPLAAAALIAAKLLAWPLLIWFLVTGRRRQAWQTCLWTVLILALTWGLIEFQGLASYPTLLADDARTYENQSHSLVAGFMHLGLTAGTASVLTLLAAAASGLAIAWRSQRSDSGWFLAAIVVGILASPIVWDHYLVVPFVALATRRRLSDPVIWILYAALWLAPTENPAHLWQAWWVPALLLAAALRGATPLPATQRQATHATPAGAAYRHGCRPVLSQPRKDPDFPDAALAPPVPRRDA